MTSSQSDPPGGDWQAIWQEHSGWIRTVLRARVGCDRLAEELLQDVNIRAWERREQLCDRAKIGPWLYRIALRQLLMHWRGSERRKQAELRDHRQRSVAVDHVHDPLNWLTQKEVHQAVRESLAKLQPQEREILMLKHMEDWTYVEISKHLGISLDKVIYRLGRAQDHLRSRLNSIDWT